MWVAVPKKGCFARLARDVGARETESKRLWGAKDAGFWSRRRRRKKNQIRTDFVCLDRRGLGEGYEEVVSICS